MISMGSLGCRAIMTLLRHVCGFGKFPKNSTGVAGLSANACIYSPEAKELKSSGLAFGERAA